MPTERRPFHETIVNATLRCSRGTSRSEALGLCQLIRETKILENHNAIIVAIRESLDMPGSTGIPSLVNETIASILEQKKEAEARATEKERDEQVSADIIECVDSMFVAGQWPL